MINRLFLVFFGYFLLSTITSSAMVTSVDKEADGIRLDMTAGVLELRVFSPKIVEVIYAPGQISSEKKSLSVISRPTKTKWKVTESNDEIVLHTDEIAVHVNRTTGAIAFFDNGGNQILAENPDNPRSLTPTHVTSIDTFRSREEFMLAPDEAVYGLGQHAAGLMNYRGSIVHLQQKNPTESAVPVLVSSRGYGILWDNPAITDVDAGKSDEKILSWESEAADTIDYYFMYGPDLDTVIGGYRELTGSVPMFGKWAWGFWQCKEHYASQQELLDVAARYRRMNVPLDGIIQDWQYWSPHPWGSHEFDTNRYPDAAGLMRTLHDENVHMLISVWAKFELGCSNVNELNAAGAVYTNVVLDWSRQHFQWYDPFNPIARHIYWDQISRELFSAGIDGWWLDASEPELSINWGEFNDYKTAAGPAVKVFNAYPLMHTTSVYQGQRHETSKKRVFILTRSAYAGQQRNAAVTWSGDIKGTWGVFAKQIPAGLNFSISGIPYWNTDTGGFFGGDPADPKYAELFTRWFQFSAFCPMFRVHGTGKPKEMWRFDDATQKILIKYDVLRYHLLPYIYSASWMVTHDGYTMMRPLIMDFRTDTNVFNIPDQFLLGPALMACPVTKAGETSRSVYLPMAAGWYDFWTGEKLAGGQTVTATSPIETMPLYVRAGSILPYGPDIQYAAQSSDPIELRVYRGADGQFTLYEDEGDNYDYEKGVYATIPITWDDTNQTLTIGKRKGRFPGMLKQRTFRIVWVSPGHGVGVPNEEKADKIIHYTGAAVTVKAND
jgi:alpha-D-xyloside xylohydrolase